jgi:hypothetical protein
VTSFVVRNSFAKPRFHEPSFAFLLDHSVYITVESGLCHSLPNLNRQDVSFTATLLNHKTHVNPNYGKGRYRRTSINLPSNSRVECMRILRKLVDKFFTWIWGRDWLFTDLCTMAYLVRTWCIHGIQV